MNSKQTDFVNAQFDDAEIRIKELFDEIMKDADGKDVPVWITTHNGGTWASRFCLTVIVYKKKGTHLKAFITYLPMERWGANYWNVNAPEWAEPPFNIDHTAGGITFWWYPDGNPNHGNWEMGSEIEEDATSDTMTAEYNW